MANIKSQIKRNRQNDKRRLRNRVSRGTARVAVKNARTAMDAGVPESKAALLEAISALDRASEKGVLHKNNAARRKSRLMKAFAKMEPVKVEAGPAKVEPVLEAGPTSSPKGKKKAAAPRKQTAKAAPKAEEAMAEPKAEPKPSSKAKKTAASTSSPKGKKTTAKKTTTPKKTTATSSPKRKKA